MIRFIATKTTLTTSELDYQFVDELFYFYGLLIDNVSDRDSKLTIIVSDRDSKLTSDFWTQILKKLYMSPMDHPQFDAERELVNEIIGDMIRAYVVAKPTK